MLIVNFIRPRSVRLRSFLGILLCLCTYRQPVALDRILVRVCYDEEAGQISQGVA
jgi:hypothetical protein